MLTNNKLIRTAAGHRRSIYTDWRKKGRLLIPRTDIAAQESRGSSGWVGWSVTYQGRRERREIGVRKLTGIRPWRILYTLSLDLLRSQK